MKTKAIAAQEIDTESRVGIYAIGTDGAMYYKIWHGDASLPSKTDWLFLDGRFDSIPSTFVHRFELSPWTTEVFGLGSNDEMFHRTVGTDSWPPPPQGWGPLGGIFNSPPAAISFGSEGSEKWAIVGLGTDNQPYLKIFDFTGSGLWLPSAGDWLPLGGILIYEPAVPNPMQDGRTAFDIFGVGEDRQMYHMIVDASRWPPTTSGWQPTGGCFTSVPAVVKWSPDRIDVFGLGMDHAMYHRASENGNWLSDWEFLGGVFDSGPEVVSWEPNRLDIFGLGTDDQMYHKAWDGSRWLPSPTHRLGSARRCLYKRSYGAFGQV
ncbi:MAG TPA: hypothetical protein VKK81_20865 [Candidatus Binatia bacterium]|nr:hypothetical protein [Candidatus Binatia bacterium]